LPDAKAAGSKSPTCVPLHCRTSPFQRDELDLPTRKNIEAETVVLLCGRAAEELTLGDASLGSGCDEHLRRQRGFYLRPQGRVEGSPKGQRPAPASRASLRRLTGTSRSDRQASSTSGQCDRRRARQSALPLRRRGPGNFRKPVALAPPWVPVNKEERLMMVIAAIDVASCGSAAAGS
jgi:hypothetical protein